MCLPIKLLKCIISFNAVIVVVLGIIAIISASFIWSKAAGNSDLLSNEDSTLKETLAIIILLCGVFLILFGIAGWYGGLKKKTHLLTVFNCGLVITLVIFTFVGSTSYVLSNVYSEQSTENCLKLNWSATIENYVAQAESTFCKQSCVCYISDPTKWPNNYFNTFSIQSNDQVQKFNNIILRQTGPSDYQSCEEFDYDREITFLNACETIFKCAGWCYPSPIYIFSDVNRGQPNKDKSCYIYFTKFMEEHGNTIGAVSLSIASLLTVSIILSICLCFHPEKKPGNLYSRMAFYE